MSKKAFSRLLRDFKRLRDAPPPGIEGAPDASDIMSWRAVIIGPDDTLWEGGVFSLELQFTAEYPTKPPKVKFLTKIYHPNVYDSGDICLDILQNKWSPEYDTTSVLTSIQSLLSDPNPDSPANTAAAQLFMNDRRAYCEQVRQCVEASWVAR